MGFQLDITDNATTQDTVDTIIKVINKTTLEGFAPQLAKALNPNTDKLQYIKRLFDFICENVDYKEDPAGWEKIVTPAKLFLDSKGDCKKMTTAIAAVLKAAGIEPLLKVVSYDGHNWKHIYVITKIDGKYYILDPVNKKTFDSEVTHKLAAVYNLAGNFEIMPGTKLSVLGSTNNDFDKGLANLCNDMDSINISGMFGGSSNVCGIDLDELSEHYSKNINPGMSGLLSKLKAAVQRVATVVKTDVNKVVTEVKKDVNAITKDAKIILGAPLRGAFLGLILLGKALESTPLKMHLAAMLAQAWQKDNGKRLSDIWTSFGGKPEELKSTIAKGASVTLSGIEDNGDFNIEGLGIVALATVGAAMAAAAPILVVIHKLFSDMGILKPGTGLDKALSTVTNAGIAAHNDDGTLPASITDKLATVKTGGITDVSKNTFIKALFLISISPVVPGILFYALNIACLSVLSIFLITKIKSYENSFKTFC
jgi:hypothetical protein